MHTDSKPHDRKVESWQEAESTKLSTETPLTSEKSKISAKTKHRTIRASTHRKEERAGYCYEEWQTDLKKITVRALRNLAKQNGHKIHIKFTLHCQLTSEKTRRASTFCTEPHRFLSNRVTTTIPHPWHWSRVQSSFFGSRRRKKNRKEPLWHNPPPWLTYLEGFLWQPLPPPDSRHDAFCFLLWDQINGPKWTASRQWDLYRFSPIVCAQWENLNRFAHNKRLLCDFTP